MTTAINIFLRTAICEHGIPYIYSQGICQKWQMLFLCHKTRKEGNRMAGRIQGSRSRSAVILQNFRLPEAKFALFPFDL